MRSFVHFKARAGLWLKVEVERMNVWRPSSMTNKDQGDRTWVWSYFAGVKKDFPFFKDVIGNIQVLYNLVDPDGQSPYAHRVNARLGFEFPLRRKEVPK